jgi:GNAT superfamily N-acetyltransferase
MQPIHRGQVRTGNRLEIQASGGSKAHLPNPTGPSEQVGFARIITDYVTFGYLTDVYVLEDHQGKGLGKWMMQCLDEILVGWPMLRRFLLLTHSPAAGRMYEKTLGACEWSESPSSTLALFERRGGGARPTPE